MLYAINLDLFDIIFYNYYSSLTISISIFILLPFGMFLFMYFKKKNSLYKSKYILVLFIILGIIIYCYINLLFNDWHIVLNNNMRS